MSKKEVKKMEKILNEILSTLKEHSRRFDSIDERFDSVDKRFVSIDERFDSVDKRFVSIDERFISIDKSFASIDERFNSIGGDLSDVKIRLGHVEDKLVSADDRVRMLSEQIHNNATEFRSHFKHIEAKLEQHEETFHVISDTLIGTKIDIDHLSKKSGLHDTEINQLKKRIHS
jgi:chromosome segregation ATPase